MAAKPVLFTVGYEGREPDELIALLQANGVDRVIDIRELPLSRRRGFSKTPLGTALRAVGIEYVHEVRGQSISPRERSDRGRSRRR